jgi:hypothetical protein
MTEPKEVKILFEITLSKEQSSSVHYIQILDDGTVYRRYHKNPKLYKNSTTNINEMLNDLKNPNISYGKTLINWTKKKYFKKFVIKNYIFLFSK